MLNDLRDTFGYKIPELFPKLKKLTQPGGIATSCPCAFWFDGQDASTFILNGINVIQWNDKSGFGRHVSQAVDAARPQWIAATGEVSFGFVNTRVLQSALFGAALVQPNTVFILCRTTVAAQDDFAFDGIANANQIYKTGAGLYSINTGIVLSGGVVDLNSNIIMAEFNGITSTIRVNGVLTAGPANAGGNTLDGITIGNRAAINNVWFIQIMEVFGYNCIITPAERVALNAYLTTKWSL